MNYWLQNYFLTFAVAIVIAGLIIPKILLIAFRKKLFDTVDERKVHRGIVPRLGGIAFLPAIGIAFCGLVGLNLSLGSLFMAEALDGCIVPLLFLLCSMLLIYLVGIADDLIGVRYRAKFIFQIIAGILIVWSGLMIDDFHGFLWVYQIPVWLGWLVTIFLVIYVLNAINLIDGIDGLASGLSGVALAWYSYVFYETGHYAYMLISAATIGTLIPFFYYNVFGNAANRTKIFMGDTGSLTIGLVLVFLSLAVFSIPSESIIGNKNVFVLAIAPIILPCFDVVRVFIHRVRMGHNPFLPDKCHIHHKLLALGFRQSKALITILLSDALIIVLNLWLSSFVQPTWIIVADVILWTLLNILLTKMIRSREKKLGEVLYE